MRILLQRVKHAEVRVAGNVTGKIEKGLLLFVGITHTDTEKEADYLAEKCANLRIFEDENGKMNLSVQDVKGEILAVSQFTLYGDARKGRRPSFVDAARPEAANNLYEYFVKKLRRLDFDIQTGRFQEHMDVELVNDGPVTLMLER